MSGYGFWMVVYIILLSLSVMSVLAAAYAFAIQVFMLSCLVLIGMGFLKRR